MGQLSPLLGIVEMADDWDEWEVGHVGGDEGFDDSADNDENDDFDKPVERKYPSTDSGELLDPDRLPALTTSTAKPSAFKSSDATLNSQWEATLSSVRTFVRHPTVTTLPWERGFAAKVLGIVHRTELLLPKLPPIHFSSSSTDSNIDARPQANLTEKLDRPGAWPIAANRLTSISWDDAKELVRSKALERLKVFMMDNPEASGLGRSLLGDISALQSESYIASTIRDVFSNKATKTLVKRAMSLSKFALFCKLKKCPVLPIDEKQVYDYMLTECIGSSSRAQQLAEALNFCGGTMQVDGATEAASSPRVKGICFRYNLTKRPFRQAQVLSVLMVSALESILASPAEFLPDRIFAGHCLMCIHGRLRWSDSQAMLAINIDQSDDGKGFVEAKSLQSKTATTASLKTTFLPLTALLTGVSTAKWAHTWLDLRTEANLVMGGSLPVMPSVLATGTFSKFPLDSSSASKWLKELLVRAGFSREEVAGISSHSLKATALSWTAKYGLSRETRQILGYHRVQGAQSALHYSRDEQAGPLQYLQTCYDEITAGTFNPDSTRSGYKLRLRQGAVWPELQKESRATSSTTSIQAGEGEKKRKLAGKVTVSEEWDDEPVIDVDKEPVVPEIEAESSTSDSQSDSGSDFVDQELAQIKEFEAPSVPLLRAPAKSAGDKLYIHKLWSTIHKSCLVDPSKLACGRPLHAGFSPIKEDYRVVRPFCKICFGS